jgi:hypothetical protein
MALRWLTNTAQGRSAADSGLSSGTAHLWWQMRFKGSFLLDKAQENTEYFRWRFVDDFTSPTVERFEFSFRKTEAGNYNVIISAPRNDDSGNRTIGWLIAIATLDPLLDPDEWYTLYIHAWPSDSNDSAIQLIDDEGTAVWSDTTQTDGANVYAMGDGTRLQFGYDVPFPAEVDAFAFGVDRLDVADRHLSPVVHGEALRYWLFEDGAGSTVAEGTTNGQSLALSGTEDTDYEWFPGDWGAGAPEPPPPTPSRILISFRPPA